MSMPPNSGKYAYCAASHADGRSIPAHRQRRQPETRRLPAIGWSACGGKPETVRAKGFSNGVYLVPLSCHCEEERRSNPAIRPRSAQRERWIPGPMSSHSSSRSQRPTDSWAKKRFCTLGICRWWNPPRCTITSGRWIVSANSES